MTFSGTPPALPRHAAAKTQALAVEGRSLSSAPKPPRIASLDWARGWMLVVSVSVNSLLVVPAWFGHAPWTGVHPLDLVFPVFVTLSGTGLAFAFSRRVNFKRMLRRFVVLMLLGLAYNAITEWSLDVLTWRVTGVLQLYAVLVTLIGLGHLVTKSWKGWAAVTALLAVAQTLIISEFASWCPAGVLTPECNPSSALDSALFGAHMYASGAAGHDPEGLVAILGATISASAGATIGHLLLWLRKHKASTEPGSSVLPILSAALYFVVLGIILKYTIPILFGAQLPTMKRLWTAPFGLYVAAGTALLLLVGHLLLDRPDVSYRTTRLSYPLIALGRNSLLVYFGSHILVSLLNRPLGSHPSVGQWVSGLFPSIWIAQLVWTGILLTFWTGLAVYLHSRKIYLRA